MRVPTLDGNVDVRVPAGTQVGDEMLLRGRGVANVLRRGDKGDLLVQFQVTIPRSLTQRQKELLQRYVDDVEGRQPAAPPPPPPTPQPSSPDSQTTTSPKQSQSPPSASAAPPPPPKAEVPPQQSQTTTQSQKDNPIDAESAQPKTATESESDGDEKKGGLLGSFGRWFRGKPEK